MLSVKSQLELKFSFKFILIEVQYDSTALTGLQISF